jgi:hypothetical protein
MRHSSARLVATSIRLAELNFPATRVHVDRTRVLFVHLDNLLHFAKADRDGRVDGYVAVSLPDELVLLFLRKGELVTAAAVTPLGRLVLPIPTALASIRQEAERGELVYADAPFEQLVWMYQSCVAPAVPRTVDPLKPESLFPELKREGFSGVVELITDGRVNYVRFERGQYAGGHFYGKDEETPVARHVEQMFARDAKGNPPDVAAAVFPHAEDLPRQAAPELIQIYRELFWSVATVADREASGDAMKHVNRLRDLVAKVHPSLEVVGLPLEREAPDIVATESELTLALAEWVSQLLEHLEIVAPGIAPEVLREATKDQRYLLQRAEFYERLPWTVRW